MPVNRQFLIFNFGVFLLFSGVIGTLSLVSSINVENGLGTSSLAVAFGSSIFSAFVVPMLIERLGCRVFVFIAEIGYLVFVLCNVYSSYNLILGGIFYGIGEAGVWTVYPTVASRYAARHSNTGSRNEETYRNHYIGYLFASVQASVIFGNAAGFFILYIDRHISNRLNVTHHVNYSICGANDCQDESVTMANIDQYTPAYDATRYIVIAVFSLFVLTAAIIHLVFLPNDRPVKPLMKLQSAENCDGTITETELMQKATINSNQRIEDVEKRDSNKTTGFSLFKSTLIASLQLFFSPKHLLVVLMPLYNGLSIGYVLGEMTRSYASCLLGLDKVALGAMLFGTGDALFSFVAGKVAGKYGRNGPYIAALLLDLANYAFSMWWIVTDDNVWLVYLLFFSFGITDGIWQTLINVMYEEYFCVRREIAYNLWNVLVNIGTFIQFAFSAKLCVYQKIYLQVTVLCCGMAGYGISQFIYHRHSSKSSSDSTRT